MAGSTRDLIVRILADTSQLAAGVGKAEGAFGKLKTGAVALGGAFAATFAAKEVISFLGDSAKAAEEDKKSQALLANQLRQTNAATDEQIAATEDAISAISRASGVADDELRPAYAALARSAGDLETADQQLATAMDIAAGRGVSLETVTKAMEKANNGNVTALGKLGVATKDAAGNTLSLEQIMAKASETYAGAAEAAVTPSQRMSIAWSELQEQVGTLILPALEKLSTFLADEVLPAVQNIVIWVQEHWPEISAAFQQVVDIVQPVLENLFMFIKTQFDIISGVIKVFSALLRGDFGAAWEAIRDTVNKVWENITTVVGNQVKLIKELFGGLISWVGELPGKLATAAGDLFGFVVDELKKMPGRIASAAVGIFDGLFDAFKGVINRIIRLFNRFLGNIGIHIHEGLGPLPDFNFDWDFPYRVPELARGGVVKTTGLAVVHEGERFSGVGPGAPGMGGGGAGIVMPGAVIHVHMEGDYDPRKVVQAVYDYARPNGGLRVPGGVTAVS